MFFPLSSSIGNLLCSSSFPEPGEEAAFCQYMEPPARSFSPQNSLVPKHQPDSERLGRVGKQLVGEGNGIYNVCTVTNSRWVIPELSYINFTASPCWGTQRCCFKGTGEKLRGHAELSACSPKRVIWQYQQRSENIRAMHLLSWGFLCYRQETHSSTQPCQSNRSSDMLM